MAKNEMTVIDKETGEILQGKEFAISEQAASGVMIGGVAYKVKQLVNVPTLKQESGETVCFRIDMPIYESESTKEEIVERNGQKVVETKITVVRVARVTELGSGQLMEYVCNAITADNLETAYPDHGYVGKCFAVQKLGLVAGKRYKDVKIIEIEPADVAA